MSLDTITEATDCFFEVYEHGLSSSTISDTHLRANGLVAAYYQSRQAYIAISNIFKIEVENLSKARFEDIRNDFFVHNLRSEDKKKHKRRARKIYRTKLQQNYFYAEVYEQIGVCEMVFLGDVIEVMDDWIEISMEQLKKIEDAIISLIS